MLNYVFYTGEGRTFSPSMNEVENLQILGFAHGESENEALSELLKENPWILEQGFTTEAISAKGLME